MINEHRQHATDDVRKLALQGTKDADVDMPMALQQIAGRQTALKKLPSWAAHDGVVYPPHLNMEQCSSEQTARYKASLTPNPSPKGEGDGVFVDLTGGFGVDFYWMSQGFKERIYVEQNEQLCSISTENFRTLGLACSVCCCDTATYLTQLDHADVIYLDPARRDEHGGRTYDIADCSPNVMELLPVLMQKADRVILKLSPMLDWRKAASDLQHVAEVHIVSVDNECKELLLVLESAVRPLRLVCVNNDHIFEVPSSNPKHPTPFTHHPTHLYEPNASIPGRSFEILAISSMNKRELKDALTGVGKANIAVRNFPLTVDQLRKKLKLKDGGDVYIFATTEADGAHSLFICRKIG